MVKEESEISEKVKHKLEEIAKQFLEIKNYLYIGTKSLTPLNYKEEYEKFFNSKTYNPQYIYKRREFKNIPKIIDDLKFQIDALYLPHELKEYFLEFLDDQKNLFFTKESIGTNKFSDNAHRLFDWGTDRLDLLLTNTPRVKFKMHIKHRIQDAEKIKQRFMKVLKRYGINDYEININTFSPHIISVERKVINIGCDIKRFECNVERLIVHEIESHVLQSENASRSSYILSELSKYGNQHLYSEGLAVYNEVATRKITPSAFDIYYGRIKAVRLLHKSFRQIYDTLLEDLTPQKAFVMTYRVKRGLADTSAPGGFPKDAAYLLGFYEIKKLIAQKFPKKLLYATRSPILSSLLQKYKLLNMENVLTPKFSK